MDFDTVIKDGHILDGTGNSWFRADVGIREGRIAEVSRTPLEKGETVIDAKGLIVCPGFINLHSHSDTTILSHNNAENCLEMGLVTELTGNCGSSAGPLSERHRKTVQEKIGDRTLIAEDKVDWLTLGEWTKKLEKKGIGINIAPLVGHGAIRSCVMGMEGEGGERVVPTEEEMSQMKAMVSDAMEEHAFGLSTGLGYAPGRNALTDEVVELCKVAARYGALYASHIRDEDNALIESAIEFITICEKSGIRGVLSHHKVYFQSNFGKICETLRLVDRARAKGTDVIIDQYPWRHGRGNKSLAEVVGLRSHIKSREELVEKLKDPQEWERLKSAAQKSRQKELELYEERMRKLTEKGSWSQRPYELEKVCIIHSGAHPEFDGKFLDEVAKALKVPDVWEAARVLLLDDEGCTCAHREPLSEDDLITILRYRWTAVSTDSFAWDTTKVSLDAMKDMLYLPHPRGWGTYPQVLGKYVRQEKILTIEEAIRKMTSLPAAFLGLWNRGLVREGYWADLVLFDPDTVKNRATYVDPCVPPKGILHVLVNGKRAVDRGRCTGILAGKVLRHND